jgi:outer membrane protein assembly factor BamB
MVATADDLLFLGTHGHVVAIRKKSGRKLWDTSLPSTGFSIVSLLFEDGVLFAGSHGHIYALDPTSGKVLWHNGLSGLGLGHMVMATTRQGTDLAVLQSQLDSDAASHAST